MAEHLSLMQALVGLLGFSIVTLKAHEPGSSTNKESQKSSSNPQILKILAKTKPLWFFSYVGSNEDTVTGYI